MFKIPLSSLPTLAGEAPVPRGLVERFPVADATNLLEFVGLHYYFVDRWRLGMNVQFTEQLAPAPSANQSRFRSYALLPQIGCNFYDPFFAALVYKVASRTNGQSHLDMAVQGLWDLDSALV